MQQCEDHRSNRKLMVAKETTTHLRYCVRDHQTHSMMLVMVMMLVVNELFHGISISTWSGVRRGKTEW